LGNDGWKSWQMMMTLFVVRFVDTDKVLCRNQTTLRISGSEGSEPDTRINQLLMIVLYSVSVSVFHSADMLWFQRAAEFVIFRAFIFSKLLTVESI
jgi:hypothetical protein